MGSTAHIPHSLPSLSSFQPLRYSTMTGGDLHTPSFSKAWSSLVASPQATTFLHDVILLAKYGFDAVNVNMTYDHWEGAMLCVEGHQVWGLGCIEGCGSMV